MKKSMLRFVLSFSIVLSIVCTVPLMAEASTVKFNATNFPDENFRKAVKAEYPKLVNDGVLSSSEIKKITNLDIREKSIKSIKGIGYFTSLVSLNCSDNPIKELPTLPDSITKLSCNACELTKIQKLPPNLSYLYCSDNEIASLPKLPDSLVEINVSDNRLKKIEGSFKNMYNLFASNNRLEGTFDASQGENILCLVLADNRLTRVVLCDGHAYSNLDLRENFLESKNYVINKNEQTVRFQFSPQKTNHDFGTYKRIKKASLTASGYRVAECNDCSVTKKKEIPRIKTVKLSKGKVAYDGKQKYVNVIVKNIYGHTLKKGRDYTVSYEDSKRVAVGRYSVTITFKGSYTGSKKLWFTVVPKAPTSLKGKKIVSGGSAAVKLTWSKVSNADGYYVYMKQGSGSYKLKKTVTSEKTVTYTVKNLQEGKTYTFKVTPYYQSKNGTKYKSVTFKTCSLTL